jgi:sec-independent protein translocase protein TatA
MIGDIMQPTHLLFVLVIALLVLGPKRLPEVGRQLGKGLRDFRAAINGEHSDHHDELGADNGHAYEPPPVEHQFAHETTQSVASEDQSVSNATEPTTNGHQFGDHAAEPVADGHEFGHEASLPVPDQSADTSASPQPAEAGTPEQQADSGTSATAGEHEFAHQPGRPDEKPADPHS